MKKYVIGAFIAVSLGSILAATQVSAAGMLKYVDQKNKLSFSHSDQYLNPTEMLAQDQKKACQGYTQAVCDQKRNEEIKNYAESQCEGSDSACVASKIALLKEMLNEKPAADSEGDRYFKPTDRTINASLAYYIQEIKDPIRSMGAYKDSTPYSYISGGRVSQTGLYLTPDISYAYQKGKMIKTIDPTREFSKLNSETKDAYKKMGIKKTAVVKPYKINKNGVAFYRIDANDMTFYAAKGARMVKFEVRYSPSFTEEDFEKLLADDAYVPANAATEKTEAVKMAMIKPIIDSFAFLK